MKSIFFAFSLVVFAYLSVDAQTYIKDYARVSGIWTKDNSPYILEGVATVPKRKTLTIEPGVTIQIGSRKIYNALLIKGNLNASGNKKEAIKFIHFIYKENKNPTCIYINKSSKINYCHFTTQNITLNRNTSDCIVLGDNASLHLTNSIIENANNAIILGVFTDTNKRYLYIENCTFNNNYNCIKAEFYTISFSRCFFNNNGSIIDYNPYMADNRTNMTNCILNANAYLSSKHLNIGHCTIHKTPIRLNKMDTVTLRNSILNSQFENIDNISKNISIYYSVLNNLDTINYYPEYTNKTMPKLLDNYTNTIGNPLFVDVAGGDFSLQANSPCIGASELRADVGAIPYKHTSIPNDIPSISTDITPPEIILLPLKNPTQNSTISLSGKVFDKSDVFQVLVNNQLTNLKDDNFFEANVQLNNIGANTITIQATDKHLNTQKTTINIVRTEKEIKYEKRLALVIGNADYDRDIGDLKNPLNDARAMKAKLESMAFEVKEYENLTYPQMQNVINEYGKRLNDYDVGLVYYSGHGISFGGENYLIPSDAVLNYEETISSECISQDFILGQMDGANTNVNILIMDACRNNTFQKSWSKSGLKEAEWVATTAPSGTFIAYSTSPEATASDGWEGNSPYTSKLLKYIDEPGLTIEQVFKKVRSAVEYEFKDKRVRQLPWENTSLKGDFYFVKE